MVFFYIPLDQWPPDINPEKPEYSWSVNRLGKWNWTIQTWQYLNEHGFKCHLTHELPEEGIILAHRQVLADDLRPGPRQLIVCILAEREWHPYAQIHLLQNPKQERKYKHSLAGLFDRLFFKMPSTAFVRYWPQPGLVPRNCEHGDRFENIVYMGIEKNIASELRKGEFQTNMKSLGLNWLPNYDKEKWTDYSDVDAILAVRSFDENTYDNKPATKLYNAWLAGVPAILGSESAFQHEGRSGEDYLEVQSVEDVFSSLCKLKDSAGEKQRFVKNGYARAGDLSLTTLVASWVNLMNDLLVPCYYQWRNTPTYSHQVYFFYRTLVLFHRLLKKKLHHRIEMLTGKR